MKAVIKSDIFVFAVFFIFEVIFLKFLVQRCNFFVYTFLLESQVLYHLSYLFHLSLLLKFVAISDPSDHIFLCFFNIVNPLQDISYVVYSSLLHAQLFHCYVEVYGVVLTLLYEFDKLFGEDRETIVLPAFFQMVLDVLLGVFYSQSSQSGDQSQNLDGVGLSCIFFFIFCFVLCIYKPNEVRQFQKQSFLMSCNLNSINCNLIYFPTIVCVLSQLIILEKAFNLHPFIINRLMITTVRNLHSKLLPFLRYNFTNKNSLINATPTKYADQRVALKENNWNTPDPTHLKSVETHLSNGQYLIHKVPVVYSDQAVVRCLGGTEIGAGHPQVYIQLNTRTAGEPVPCKWCGIRYAFRHHH